MSLWYIGALLSIAGSIGSNLGINIQKYSFLQNSKLPVDQQKAYTRQAGWAIGLALVIGGSVGDFAALALAAQSIITPIGSVTLVANMVFAHYWLKETLSKRDMIGTVLIILGSVLTVSFGDHSDPKYNLTDFRSFFSLTSSIVYTFIILLVSSILYAFILYLRPIKRAIVTIEKEYELISPESLRTEKMNANETLAALRVRYRPWEKVHPFCYCALSGMLGAQSVLFGKMVSELISTTFQGDNQLLSPFPYVFLVCMLAFVFSQLHFLALALTYFDALYCVPIFQCFFILTSTIGGAAFFEEFASFSPVQAIVFPIGVATTLLGVFVLAQRDSSSVQDGRAEGPGHHVIPASLATFFVDIDREKKQSCRELQRSWSHNWHHGGVVSRVQQDKVQMEALASAAALSAQKGEMKLSADVEASVMREVSAATPPPSSFQQRHKRDSSRMMSSVRTANMGPSDTNPASPLNTGLKSMDEAMSPSALADRARRKVKSRSHPTHFITPSCLLQDVSIDTLQASGGGSPAKSPAKSPTHEALALPAALPSPHGRNPYQRLADPLPPLVPSDRLRPAGEDDGLRILPMARDLSVPVPKHLNERGRMEGVEEKKEEEINPLDQPVPSPELSTRESVVEEGGEVVGEKASLLPGQLESIVVDP